MIVQQKKKSTTTKISSPSVSPYDRPFDPNSIVGKTVLQAFDENTVDITVDAPPGSGKTTTLVMIVKELITQSDAQILVVAPTRNQIIEIADRLIQIVPANSITINLREGPDTGPLQSMLTAKREREAKSVLASSTKSPGHVVLSTISRAAMSIYKQPRYHFLIVDEAYQATYGDYTNIVNSSLKHIFMGDPGQIGPVVTVPTQFWSSSRSTNPTRRLQDVIRAASKETAHYTIDTTWRLGPKTTKIINALYPFKFSSSRPATDLRIGQRSLDEIEVVDIHTPLERESPVANDSVSMMKMVARRCVSFINDGYVTRDGKERKLEAKDIAIVVGYNYQVEEAVLVMKSMCGGSCPVEVTTADRAQGKEWCVILAVDPASIPGGAASHSFSDGRLSVMISRHYGHLTWYGTHPDELLEHYDESLISDRALEVRGSIYRMPVIDEF